MSRQEEINRQLASRVDLEYQDVAMTVKNSLKEDLKPLISDDEAIIITERYYKDFDKRSSSIHNATIIISGIVFFLAGVAWFDGFIGAIAGAAFGYFFGKELAKKDGHKMSAEIAERFRPIIERNQKRASAADQSVEAASLSQPGKPASQQNGPRMTQARPDDDDPSVDFVVPPKRK